MFRSCGPSSGIKIHDFKINKTHVCVCVCVCVRALNLRDVINCTTQVQYSLAQLVQRLATGLTDQKSNPGGRKIFRNRPDRP
jgi:hypothetical protein